MNESDVKKVDEPTKGAELYYMMKGSWLSTARGERIEIKQDIGESVEKKVKVLCLEGPSIIITSLAGDTMRMVSGGVPLRVQAVGEGVEPVGLIGRGPGVWDEVEIRDERIRELESTVKAMWTDEAVDSAIDIAIRPYKKVVSTMLFILFILLLEVIVASLFLILRFLL